MFGIVFKFERWRYNSEYDVYVSSEGRLRDKNKKEILPKISHNYLFYITNINCISKRIPVHRLVMITFNPVENYKNLTVDHLNHNTRDNRLQNLEWVESEENYRRAKRDQDIQLEQDFRSGKDIGIPVEKDLNQYFLLNGVRFDKESIVEMITNCPELSAQKETIEKKLNDIFVANRGTRKAYGFYIEPYKETPEENLKLKVNGFVFNFNEAIDFMHHCSTVTCAKATLQTRVLNFLQNSKHSSATFWNFKIEKYGEEIK